MARGAAVVVGVLSLVAFSNAFSYAPGLHTATLRPTFRCVCSQKLALRQVIVSVKLSEGPAAEAKTTPRQAEPNLCDVNSQLCDGDIHTAPVDLDISTKSPPEKENLMARVKATGIAGLISYAAWEFVFWAVSAPTAVVMYHQTTGEWPNFNNPESTAKVSAVIFGFLNFARALVPVRIGLTLATVPLVDKYVVKPFNLGKSKEAETNP